MDGVYCTTDEGPVLHPVKAPTAEQLHTLLHQTIKRVMTCLTRQGYLVEEQDMAHFSDTEADTAMAPLQSAACTYRIASPQRQAVPRDHSRPTGQRHGHRRGVG